MRAPETRAGRAWRLPCLLLAAAWALPGCASLSGESGARSRPDFAVAASEWGSHPDRMSDALRQTPRFITIHHAGTEWKSGSDPAEVLRRLQRYGQRAKGWPDVPYHFLIAPDGRIFEGRALGYAGDTNTLYDTTGHVQVQLWGNFEEQRVGAPQLAALVRLLAWLVRTQGIPPDRIAGHLDRSPDTVCPGRDLDRYIANGDVQGWVEQALAGEEPAVSVRPPLADGPIAFVPTD